MRHKNPIPVPAPAPGPPKTGAGQQLTLQWNLYPSGIMDQFISILGANELVDCTIAVENQLIPVHKLVLSACSPYFRRIFNSNPCKHPIVFVANTTYRHVRTLIDFMYHGKVDVSPGEVSEIMKLAKEFYIRGLCDESEEREEISPSPKLPAVSQSQAPLHRDVLVPESSSSASSSKSQVFAVPSENVPSLQATTSSRSQLPVPLVEKVRIVQVGPPSHPQVSVPSPQKVRNVQVPPPFQPQVSIASPKKVPVLLVPSESSAKNSETPGKPKLPQPSVPNQNEPEPPRCKSSECSVSLHTVPEPPIPVEMSTSQIPHEGSASHTEDNNQRNSIGTESSNTLDFDDLIQFQREIPLLFYERALSDIELQNKLADTINKKLIAGTNTISCDPSASSSGTLTLGSGGSLDKVMDETFQEAPNENNELDQYIHDFLSTIEDGIGLNEESEPGESDNKETEMELEPEQIQKTEDSVLDTTQPVTLIPELISYPPSPPPLTEPASSHKTTFTVTVLNDPKQKSNRKRRGGNTQTLGVIDTQEHPDSWKSYDSPWKKLGRRSIRPKIPRLDIQESSSHNHNYTLENRKIVQIPNPIVTVQHPISQSRKISPKVHTTISPVQQKPQKLQGIKAKVSQNHVSSVVGVVHSEVTKNESVPSSMYHIPISQTSNATSLKITGTPASAPEDLPMVHIQESPQEIAHNAQNTSTKFDDDEILEPKTPAQPLPISMLVPTPRTLSSQKHLNPTASSGITTPLLTALLKSANKMQQNSSQFTDLTTKPIINDRKSFSTPRKKHVRHLTFSTPQRPCNPPNFQQTPVSIKPPHNNISDTIANKIQLSKSKKRLDLEMVTIKLEKDAVKNVKPKCIKEVIEIEPEEEEEEEEEDGEIISRSPSPPPIEIDLTDSPGPKVNPPIPVPLPEETNNETSSTQIFSSIPWNPPPTPRIKGSEPNSFYDWQPGGSFYLTPAKEILGPPRTPGRSTPDGSRNPLWTSILDTPYHNQNSALGTENQQNPTSLDTPKPKLKIDEILSISVPIPTSSKTQQKHPPLEVNKPKLKIDEIRPIHVPTPTSSITHQNQASLETHKLKLKNDEIRPIHVPIQTSNKKHQKQASLETHKPKIKIDEILHNRDPIHPCPKIVPTPQSDPKVQEHLVTSSNLKKEEAHSGSNTQDPRRSSYEFTVSGRPKKLTICEQQSAFGLLALSRANTNSTKGRASLPATSAKPYIDTIATSVTPGPPTLATKPATSNTVGLAQDFTSRNHDRNDQSSISVSTSKNPKPPEVVGSRASVPILAQGPDNHNLQSSSSSSNSASTNPKTSEGMVTGTPSEPVQVEKLVTQVGSFDLNDFLIKVHKKK